MGRRNGSMNALLYEYLRQCKRFLYCLWPISNARQDMQMCIDHGLFFCERAYASSLQAIIRYSSCSSSVPLIRKLDRTSRNSQIIYHQKTEHSQSNFSLDMLIELFYNGRVSKPSDCGRRTNHSRGMHFASSTKKLLEEAYVLLRGYCRRVDAGTVKITPLGSDMVPVRGSE